MKKMFSILLVIVLAFALIGCAAKQETEEVEDVEPIVEEEVVPAVEEEATEEPAVDEEATEEPSEEIVEGEEVVEESEVLPDAEAI